MRHSRRTRRHRNEKQVDGLLHDDTPAHMHIGSIIAKGRIESAKWIAFDIEITPQMIGHRPRAMRNLFSKAVHRDAISHRIPRRKAWREMSIHKDHPRNGAPHPP